MFRPITRVGGQERSDPGERPGQHRDYILELLLAHTTAGLAYDECVGVGYAQLHEDPDAALADIVDRFHRVAEQCDAVVIVGSDYTDVASPSELGANARIAVNLDHRPAMSFLVMGMAAAAPIEIDDGSPIDTSFPGFTELMNGLGAGIGLLNV